MGDSIYGKLTLVFRVTCWTATVLLLCYWIYFFSLDEDICLVDYKEYYDSPTHAFPTVSLCLKNPFPKQILMKKAKGFDPDFYSKFLEGSYFDFEYANISYKTAVLNITKYVDNYWIEWRNGSSQIFPMSHTTKEIFRTSYSGFWRSNFYNCYSLQIPHDKAIMAFQVELSNTIFPSGKRDRNYSTLTLLHAQNQFLTAPPKSSR